MPDPSTLDDLVDIHAIERLKYRYFRYLDRKQWDELSTCLTEDATAVYGGGAVQLEGRDAIIGFLIGALGSTSILTSHQGSHPEIDLVPPGGATGIWALRDVIIHKDAGVTIHGASFYEDRYVKRDGLWFIESTGYTRTYEEMLPRASIKGVQITADFWETGGQSNLL